MAHGAPDYNLTTVNSSSVQGSVSVQVGDVMLWGAAALPAQWLQCNGQAVNRTAYATLFNIIGSTYGSGDGSTTFNLPDIRDNVIVGINTSDANFNTIAQKGGEATHVLSAAEMPSHSHKMFSAGSGINTPQLYAGSANAGSSTLNSAGGGAAHNNLQPYIILYYIICAGV